MRRRMVMAADHWLKVAGCLLLIALLIGAVAAFVGGEEHGVEYVGLAETSLGVVLAIFIFAWTLSGFAAQRADLQEGGRKAFADEVSARRYVGGEIPDWAKTRLATVLKVPTDQVEGELALWLIEERAGGGGRVVLAVTRRLWFLRATAQRGGQVLDLATGERLDQ
jgi:hypothetical protein